MISIRQRLAKLERVELMADPPRLVVRVEGQEELPSELESDVNGNTTIINVRFAGPPHQPCEYSATKNLRMTGPT
jgi:hypothetical protein